MSNVAGLADEMTGRKLKESRGYVFVKLSPDETKHLFGGDESPTPGDFTVCGQRIYPPFLWAQAAPALKGNYCRECERIWSQS